MAEDQLGPLDVWVNDAMTTSFFLRPLGPSSMPQLARSRTTAVRRLGAPGRRFGGENRVGLSDATINPAYQEARLG